ncbi:MAG: hypothetical protein ACK4NY_00455 [Spirosomataceae bacterium]
MNDWLYQFAVYAEYFPILLAIFCIKSLDKSLKWFLLGSILSTFGSIVSLKLSQRGINNHFMIYVNATTLFIFRTLFFYYFLDSKKLKISLLVCLFSYLILVVFDIFTKGIYMNELLFSIYDVWLIIFCLISLNQIFNDESIESLRAYPHFWIVLGTLIFIVFDFLLTLLNNWLYAVNRNFFFVLWDYIVPIFMLIRVVMLSVGFWLTRKYRLSLM